MSQQGLALASPVSYTFNRAQLYSSKLYFPITKFFSNSKSIDLIFFINLIFILGVLIVAVSFEFFCRGTTNLASQLST